MKPSGKKVLSSCCNKPIEFDHSLTEYVCTGCDDVLLPDGKNPKEVFRSMSETRRINIMKEKPKADCELCHSRKAKHMLYNLDKILCVCELCAKGYIDKGFNQIDITDFMKKKGKPKECKHEKKRCFNCLYWYRNSVPNADTGVCDNSSAGQDLHTDYNHICIWWQPKKPVESRDEKTKKLVELKEEKLCFDLEYFYLLKDRFEELEKRIDEQDSFIDTYGKEIVEHNRRLDELKEKHNMAGHIFEASTRNLWTEIGLLKDKIEKLEKKLTKTICKKKKS